VALTRIGRTLLLLVCIGHLYSGLPENSVVAAIQAYKGSIDRIEHLDRTDSFIAASSVGKLSLWKLKDNRKIKKLSSVRLNSKIITFKVSPDEKTLAVATEKKIKIYSFPELKLIAKTESEFYAELFVFSEDGRNIAAVLSDGELCIYSSKKMKLEKVINTKGRITSIAFSPDGLKFVTGTEDGTITLWSTFLYKPVKTVKLSVMPITLIYSSKGNYIISIGSDYRIRNMRASNFEIFPKVFDIPENTSYFALIEKDKLVFLNLCLP